VSLPCVDTTGATAKYGCADLEGRAEDVWHRHEQHIPQQQAKECGPDATLTAGRRSTARQCKQVLVLNTMSMPAPAIYTPSIAGLFAWHPISTCRPMQVLSISFWGLARTSASGPSLPVHPLPAPSLVSSIILESQFLHTTLLIVQPIEAALGACGRAVATTRCNLRPFLKGTTIHTRTVFAALAAPAMHRKQHFDAHTLAAVCRLRPNRWLPHL
jgi:hypothetical protein